jgi:NitT/TauT family transport system permease protein
MTQDMASAVGIGVDMGSPPALRDGRRGPAVRARVVNTLWSLLLLAVVLGSLEFICRSGWVSSLLFPPPSAIARTLWEGLRTGIYVDPLLNSMTAGVIGFFIATFFGFILGGLLASMPRLEQILFPYIVAFQSTPLIAIAPIIIIWIGFGMKSKIAVVVVVCFFPVLVNTLQGLRLRDRDRQELAMALGATPWQVFRYIRLPGSMPYVFGGLHVSAIFAILGAIVAEFVGARGGLGTMMNEQRSLFNVPGVFAILIILMAVGLVVNLLMKSLERRVTFWARERD